MYNTLMTTRNPLTIEAWLDSTAKPGDIVEARWTNSFTAYGAKASIVKINRSSVRVKMLDGHLEGREIHAEGATGGAGGVDHGVGEVAVEEEVAFIVGVAASAEIGGADLVGAQRHGGGEAGAHGAFAIRCDEGNAAGVGEVGVFEARGVATGGDEVFAIGAGGGVVAQFAKEGGAQAKAGGAYGGVARRASGGGGGLVFKTRDDGLHFVVVDEHHAALGAGEGGEEGFRHTGQKIHDGRTDANEIKG